MAAPSNVRLVTALISLTLLLFLPSTTAAADPHDLLPAYNLPKGLLPRDIKSYTLSNTSFTVELISNPCYVKFGDQLVYYDRVVKGRLGRGRVTGVSGIQAKKLFVWVSVSGIDVVEESGMIEFHVGALSQRLPAEKFADIQRCEARVMQGSFSFLEGLLI